MRRTILLPLIAVAVIGALLRPRLRNWGATAEERAMPMPGDDLIPGDGGASTMAIDIAAPPSAVWPWLAQMGNDRAGWYSWDRLDNGGEPSAQTIHPEWTTIAKGDRLVSMPGRSWFDVAHVEVDRSLVLRAPMDLLGRPYDATGPRPQRYMDSRWEFLLLPVDDGRATRLLVRSSGTGAPQALLTPVNLAFGHPAHLIMQTHQLGQLQRRCEAAAGPAPAAAPAPAALVNS